MSFLEPRVCEKEAAAAAAARTEIATFVSDSQGGESKSSLLSPNRTAVSAAAIFCFTFPESLSIAEFMDFGSAIRGIGEDEKRKVSSGAILDTLGSSGMEAVWLYCALCVFIHFNRVVRVL